MIATKVALAVGAVWLLGAFGLAQVGVRRGGLLGLAADFAAGVVVLALVGSIAVITGMRLSPIAVYALVAAFAVVAAVRRRGVGVALELPRDVVARPLLVAAVLPIFLLGLSSLGDRLWWDGWAIWAFKARMLFVDGTLPAAYFEPRGRLAFSHPGYPLAVPMLDWWLFRHAGAADPAIASIAGTLWHALLVGAVFGALRSRAGERLAALAALGTAFFWPIAFYASGGTADVVVAIALVAGLSEMETGVANDDVASSTRSGVFLALGAMAKAEGLAVACAVGAVALFSLLRRRALRRAHVLAYALPFIVLAPWQAFVAIRGVGRDFFTIAITPAELYDRAVIFFGAVGTIALKPTWLPIVGLLALGIVRRSSNEAWIALAGYFAAIAAPYLFTPVDHGWLVDTSLVRVLAACVPAALYVALAGTVGKTVVEDRVHAT